jgi:hypothetical protein
VWFIEINLLLDGAFVHVEKGFLVLDTIIWAVGAELLAEGHMKIKPNVGAGGWPGRFSLRHAEPARASSNQLLNDGLPNDFPGYHRTAVASLTGASMATILRHLNKKDNL